jgi:hypothetical protein
MTNTHINKIEPVNKILSEKDSENTSVKTLSCSNFTIAVSIWFYRGKSTNLWLFKTPKDIQDSLQDFIELINANTELRLFQESKALSEQSNMNTASDTKSAREVMVIYTQYCTRAASNFLNRNHWIISEVFERCMMHYCFLYS